MPRSILTADQHEPLRRREYNAKIALNGLWDLTDVRPIFNVPSCVLFANKITSEASKEAGKPLPTIVWDGRLGSRNLDWSNAKEFLTETPSESNLINMGSRTALSVGARTLVQATASVYLDRFLIGATIYPRNFFFVSFHEIPDKVRLDSSYWIATDEEQAKESKPPYRDVRMSGRVDGRFLFRSAISKHILPFAVLEPAIVALPIIIDQQGTHIQNADQLDEDGFRDFGRWMHEVEDIWNKLRGMKSDRQSVYQRLDYQKGLSSQVLSSSHLVLYNAAGTNISAAVFSRDECEQTFIVDHTLCYLKTSKRKEANYLAAILNTSVVNLLIKPFQSVGLQGERHIHKKVLELPIPLFDDRKPEHLALAKLGEEARKQAAVVIASAKLENWPGGLARRRAIVRQGLGDVLDRIDQAVKQLFGVAD